MTNLSVPLRKVCIFHDVVDPDHAHGAAGGVVGVAEGHGAVEHGGGGSPARAHVQRAHQRRGHAPRYVILVECLVYRSTGVYFNLCISESSLLRGFNCS